MEGGGHNEEVASSKKKTNSSLECKNRYPIYDQNGQNRYPIYDQNGWKTLPFGAAHTYIAHIREYPPPPRASSYQFIMIYLAALLGDISAPPIEPSLWNSNDSKIYIRM